MTSASGGADMVDWNLAVATATRLVRPGPEVSREEAAAVVAELRRHALEAEEHVRAFTGMRSSSLSQAAATPVLVVDRPGWIRANVAGFRTVVQPLVEKLQARRANSTAAGVFGAVGEKATGIEVGALLAFLSTKVLGQYETFAPAEPPLEAPDSPAALFDKPRLGPEGPGPGRLLLVAPNIVHVERELDVDPSDFRLWVCLHEETHRTQFTAVPWLRDHIQSEVQSFLAETDVDPGALLERLRDAAGSLGGLPGGGSREGASSGNLLEIVQSPAQREILGRLTAVMSLLEGHADVVMDGVGPAVVPTVAEIREKFQQRRDRGANRLDLLLRRLLGMDAKLRQYQDGAVFVRGVVEQVGMEGFNRVWTSPNTLPTKDEIHDPAAWVARVAR
ncbi:coenzyme F420 biosynthesis-associated protein [Kitasatospora xanthocidica]|uniref:Coenzyme F420 biosynthesis-associated protein n=1 Tax=Kitasatospora xanthocidica TaxID=83382 RepID=A0A372ZYB4_9ACTN|nr:MULTISPECIES: zinc-dependent metalloprotease [Streptomycetaceae]OKH96985.1 coenzyme F420 biosynthesis-associated protein [Streptomyces sp. CB02056]RGD60863.1 coenzyme F420 biosynthesis-associated protein [Kitasatospora xanthocidica]